MKRRLRSPGPIYVEIQMTAPIEEVWRRSQDPDDHSRWDLRFTRIELLPKAPASQGAPTPLRHFRYAVGPVTGVGATGAVRTLVDGSATSALRFRSDHRFSPLRSGSGYWRYLPASGGAAGGTTFLTRYDYIPRGPADRVVRPLLGWATAWSFDRLRLWVDEGITPEQSRLRAVLELTARLTVGGAGLAVAGSGSGVVPGALVGPVARIVLGGALLIAALVVRPHRLTPSARRCRRHPDHPVRPAPEVLP
ncbi:MAG: SRPBCC family protein [Lapillicoccus sp.]